EALGEGGVLGVDGDDLLARAGGGVDEVAADDERLLVGERKAAPRSQRGEGRGQPDRPDDAVEDDVGAAAGELGGRGGAGEDLDVGEGGGQLGGGGGVGHRDGGDAEPSGLLGEEGGVAAGGEAGDPEPVGVAGDDVERLGADRAGGAEHHHGGGHRTRSWTRSAAPTARGRLRPLATV